MPSFPVMFIPPELNDVSDTGIMPHSDLLSPFTSSKNRGSDPLPHSIHPPKPETLIGEEIELYKVDKCDESPQISVVVFQPPVKLLNETDSFKM
jgi:hypothetical protein